MTPNIDKAFDAAQKMADDYQQKIDDLEALKEVYQKIGEDEHYDNNTNLVASELEEFINDLRSAGYALPIYGVFGLVTEYPSVNAIELKIQGYKEAQKQWCKIRNMLGR